MQPNSTSSMPAPHAANAATTRLTTAFAETLRLKAPISQR
jgi:hypothetical protein